MAKVQKIGLKAYIFVNKKRLVGFFDELARHQIEKAGKQSENEQKDPPRRHRRPSTSKRRGVPSAASPFCAQSRAKQSEAERSRAKQSEAERSRAKQSEGAESHKKRFGAF